MLLFKKKFLDAIRAGDKTQTIRLWQHCRMKTGQRSYIPGVGYIHVESVDLVELADLTDADAMLDGFATAELLRREIETIYSGQLASGHRTYRIRFVVLPPAGQAAAKAARAARQNL